MPKETVLLVSKDRKFLFGVDEILIMPVPHSSAVTKEKAKFYFREPITCEAVESLGKILMSCGEESR